MNYQIKKKLYDPPINNNLKKYDNIRKIATGQSDDYTTGFLLDYLYFKNYYKLIATDLSKKKKTRCWSKSNTGG